MPTSAADWIFANGEILTCHPTLPRAGAVAISGEHVVALGSGQKLRSLRGRKTRWVDLAGATVIPGFIDAHAHMDREGLKFLYPSLASCRSIAEIKSLIRRLANRIPPGEWIVTMPVGAPPFYLDAPNCLAERRMPDRGDLDAAAPDHPVYIRGIWGFWNTPPIFYAANSRALRLAGISRESIAPKGVEIVRDAAGEPTGVFIEHNVTPIVEFTLLKSMPRFTAADRLRALKDAQRRYHSRGVTSIYEGHGVAPEVLAAFRELHGKDQLTMRSHLVVSPTWRSLPEAERDIPSLASWTGGAGIGDGVLRMAGIYLGYGGDVEISRILTEASPYTGWAGFVEQAHDPDTYRALARLARSLGLRVGTIVSGKLEEILEIWEELDKDAPLRAQRWTLVHLARVTRAQMQRIRRLGAMATTNPLSHIYSPRSHRMRDIGDGEEWLPHRALLQQRVPFGIGTDNKIADPFVALWSVAGREDFFGTVIGPRQKLTIDQALR
ncbi:MAG TPA: amidohydrolase family protein, partial [Candidatus Binatia bacterium]|nr:amidohydrolase family protein [Candidatus Binatia bacterium]